MSKKLGKQLVAPTAALMLVASLIGCSGGDNKNANSGASSAAATQNTQEVSSTPSQKPAEVVKLSLYGPQFGGNYQSGEQTDEVAKEIEKRLGVSLQIETHPDEQKFNLMLASGDLPDVMVTEQKFIKQLVEGGRVLPLDELVQSKGKQMVEEFPQKFEFSKKYYSNDTGKLYFVPGYDGPIPPAYTYDSVALVTRWDLYKKLGYPEYKSLDDLLPILKKMQDLEPVNEQGQKVYALSPWFDWGLWSATTYPANNLNGASGDLVEFDAERNMKTNILQDDAAFWQGARFYNKANRLGILDPDSFTQKFENHVEKAKANRILFSWVSWSGESDATKAYAAAGQKDKGFAALPPIKGGYQYNGDYNDLGQGSRLYAISKNSKNPEKAMELINFLNSYEGSELLLNGIEGKHWSVENGKPQMKPEIIQQSLNDPNFAATTGIGKYTNWVGHGPGSIDPKYNVPIDFFSSQEAFKAKLTDLDKEMSEHYGVEYPGQVVENAVKSGDIKFASFNGIYNAVTPTDSDDIKRIKDNIVQYLNKKIPELVLTKNDEQYESMKAGIIAKLKEMDVQKVIDDAQTKAATARETAKPYLR
ncbi:extracellular solute-binding protein [Cohnella soli]|uniref:Extracellular solute-binding protein n=1 Tax=Cohnella soli TaxID=425005 RepID=A0ABW0I194_9BACL